MSVIDIPAGIRGQINRLGHFFGGFEGVVRLLPTEDLIKIAIFNGPVGTISPFAQLGKESDPVVPLHELSLRAIGYEGGTRYSVLNSNHQLVYRDFPARKGEDWIFGLGDKDRKLIERGRHGEYFYINFRNSRGPQLAIVWLCKELPEVIIERRLSIWEELRDKVRGQEIYDELIIKPSSGVIELGLECEAGSVSGVMTSAYEANSIRELVIGGEGELLTLSTEIFPYIRLKANRWYSFWINSPSTRVPLRLINLEGLGLGRVYESLSISGAAYFIRGFNSSGSWLFSSGVGSAPVVSNPFEERNIRISGDLVRY